MMRLDSQILAGSEAFRADRAALEAQLAEHPQTCKGIISWSCIKAPSGAASLPWLVDRLMDEAGRGPSCGDRTGGRVGFENDLTRRNITIMTRSLLPRARMLRDGLPEAGRERNERAVGPRSGFEISRYRS